MKRMVWAAICSALVLSTTMPVAYASSLSAKKHQLSTLKAKSNATAQKLSTEKKTASSLKQSITDSKSKIRSISDQITSDQTQMQALEAELQSLDKKISANNDQLTKDNADLKSILLANYEGGAVPYLQVLFQATSWNDFLTRAEAISMLAQHEKDLLNQVQTITKQLASEKTQKSANYKQIQVDTANLQSLETTYQSQQKKQAVTLAQLNDTIQVSSRSQSLLESQIQLTQSEISQIEAATAAAQSEEQNASYVSSQAAGLRSINVNALISYGEQYRGDPYVFGANGPNAWDCSSFTQHVFGHFGIYLPRVTWDQFARGVPVSRANLKPGDLLFFHTYAYGASHVGIYIGGGKMLNAEDAGVMVTDVFTGTGASVYWAPKFIGARDVIRH